MDQSSKCQGLASGNAIVEGSVSERKAMEKRRINSTLQLVPDERNNGRIHRKWLNGQNESIGVLYVVAVTIALGSALKRKR